MGIQMLDTQARSQGVNPRLIEADRSSWAGAVSHSPGALAEVRAIPGGTHAVAAVGDAAQVLRGRTTAPSSGSYALVERGSDQVFVCASGDAMVLMRSVGGSIRIVIDGQQRRDLDAMESAVLVVGVVGSTDLAMLQDWLQLGVAPEVVRNLFGPQVEHALVFIDDWSTVELGDALVAALAHGAFEPLGSTDATLENRVLGSVVDAAPAAPVPSVYPKKLHRRALVTAALGAAVVFLLALVLALMVLIAIG